MNNILARLPWWLSKGPLKRDFLDIYLTTFSKSVISEIQNLWGSSFFSKCSKFDLVFKNGEKKQEKVFRFWDNCIWIDIVKFSLLRRAYLSSALNVLTRSPKTWYVDKRDFFRLNCLQIYQESVISEIQNLWASPFFSKCSIFNLDFKHAEKNPQIFFCFWDNLIWIGIVKFSLLRTGYLSSEANVLTTSLKNWHVYNTDFFQLNCLESY